MRLSYACSEDSIREGVRRMAEAGRRGAARQAAELLGTNAVKSLNLLWTRPERFLARSSSVSAAPRICPAGPR